MAEPFVGEIRLMSFNFRPKGWAMCNGQLLPINQNQALFALLGTMYGGDGRTTFALPDLRGRTVIHTGSGHTQGESAGEQAHTLTANEMPTHLHPLNASSSAGNDPTPGAHVLASPLNLSYRAPDGLTPLAAGTIAGAGGSQAHPNMQPFLALNFCIALVGIFPSRN
jgi:microcystin-dependent protein